MNEDVGITQQCKADHVPVSLGIGGKLSHVTGKPYIFLKDPANAALHNNYNVSLTSNRNHFQNNTRYAPLLRSRNRILTIGGLT